MFNKLTRRAYAALIKVHLDKYDEDDELYNKDELLKVVATLVVDQHKQIEKLGESLKELKKSIK